MVRLLKQEDRAAFGCALFDLTNEHKNLIRKFDSSLRPKQIVTDTGSLSCLKENAKTETDAYKNGGQEVCMIIIIC